jgi:hypothetical protein
VNAGSGPERVHNPRSYVVGERAWRCPRDMEVGHDVEADALPVPTDGQIHVARDRAEDRHGLLEFGEHVIVAGGHRIRLLARDRRANNGDGIHVKPEPMTGSVTRLSAAADGQKPQPAHAIGAAVPQGKMARQTTGNQHKCSDFGREHFTASGR